MRISRFTATLLPAVALASSLSPASRAGPHSAPHWVWPLQPVPPVVRYFEPPRSPYGPGHRGVDLAGATGQQVLSVADGTVTFAGTLAGRGVVVVDHGRLRSTYLPVTPIVSVGDQVAAGQQVGLLALVGSHCLPDPCLHLGARDGDRYLDPLSLLGPRPVVLKPLRLRGGDGGGAGAARGSGLGSGSRSGPGFGFGFGSGFREPRHIGTLDDPLGGWP